MEGDTINYKALIGSIAGTAVPLAIMLKKQKTVNPTKLEYGAKPWG